MGKKGTTNATKVVGAPYVSRMSRATDDGFDPSPSCKAVVNRWFASATAAYLRRMSRARSVDVNSGEGDDDDDDNPGLVRSCPSSCQCGGADETWALVLDTEALATVRALDAAGATPSVRCVVPNPDDRVATACADLGAHGVVTTSHRLLNPDGPVHPLVAERRQKAREAAEAGLHRPRERNDDDEDEATPEIPGLPVACRGAIGCAWLDYCGGISSRAGRRRREDVRALMENKWLAPHAVLALTVSHRGSPAMYDGDCLDAAVLLVRDAAMEEGRRAEVVGTCTYVERGSARSAPRLAGRGEGVTGERERYRAGRGPAAKMYTVIFAVAPETVAGDGSGDWLKGVAASLPRPVPVPGMEVTDGWTLKLAGLGASSAAGVAAPGTGTSESGGSMFRDAAMQRAAAASFATAAASLADEQSPRAPGRCIALESRLLPCTTALRAALPNVEVSVAVEDDLDRLVAVAVAERLGSDPVGDLSSASPSVEVRASFWDLLTDECRGDDKRHDGGVEKMRGARGGDSETRRPLTGAFLDYTGRTKGFGRPELAACGDWPQLTAVFRNMLTNDDCRGVIAVLVNVSDDVEYWEGLAVDYLVHGIRAAAATAVAGIREGEVAAEAEADVEVLEVMSTSSALLPRVFVLAEVSVRGRPASGVDGQMRTKTAVTVTEDGAPGRRAGEEVGVRQVNMTMTAASIEAEQRRRSCTQPPPPPLSKLVTVWRGWDEARAKVLVGSLAVAMSSLAMPAVKGLAAALTVRSRIVSPMGSTSDPAPSSESAMIAEPGGLGVTPALLAMGYRVEAVACDPVHFSSEVRRSCHVTRVNGDGMDGVESSTRVHASPLAAAASLDKRLSSVMMIPSGMEKERDVNMTFPSMLLLLTPVHDIRNRQRDYERVGWKALMESWVRLCVSRGRCKESLGKGCGDDADRTFEGELNQHAVPPLGGVIVLIDATNGAEKAAVMAREALIAMVAEAVESRSGATGAATASQAEGAMWTVEVCRVSEHVSRCRRYALVTLTIASSP